MSSLFGTSGNRTVEPPLPGVGYTSVLRTQTMTTGAFQSLVGVLLVLAGYSLLLPALALAVLGPVWMLRGRPGTFTEYQAAALEFHTIDGMVASHVAIASMIVMTMVAIRYVNLRHPRWLASVQPGFRWRFAVVCALVALVLLNAVYWISRIGNPFNWNPDDHFGWWVVAIVLTAPLQAAGEEFFFRGYLLQAAGSVASNRWLAVVVSAVIFAAFHGTQNLPLLVDRFGFGLMAGALVVLTGGLEAAIAAHAVNNVFAFGYAAAAGGIAQARTIQVSTWATTGWDLLGYGLVVLACWMFGRRMQVATRTPGLESGAQVR
ncbi:MAG: CPBP family intramembrane glutamic endopeptidase [Brooklawnia sp.]